MDPRDHEYLRHHPREVQRALRQMFYDASEEDIREAMAETDSDFSVIAEQAGDIVAGALARHARRGETEQPPSDDILDLRRSLGTLLQLLRRRGRLTQEDLAARACIDLDEVRKIESDPLFSAHPRTIFQLEQYFDLPERSLVVLSGHLRSLGAGVHDEAVRFAAHASSLGQLTRDETKLLNAFVAFLKDHTKPE